MFDDKLNQQLAGAGNQQPFGSVDGLGSNPNQASAGKQDLPPVALPATGQPEVSPKPGRSIPGTEDIFARVPNDGHSPEESFIYRRHALLRRWRKEMRIQNDTFQISRTAHETTEGIRGFGLRELCFAGK